MLKFLRHFLIPQESNNHRAKLLHIEPLFILVVLLFTMIALTPRIEHYYPQVLGISANISIDDLVNLTNQQRAESGLTPLKLDNELILAANKKAVDMFAKNYWAHTAPDGTTPWVFIKDSGYEYLYAGENLARGFTTAPEAVKAWMASPGHRSNILSANYKDVGFSVVTGTLGGEETVLIVEMFGNRLNSTQAVNSESNIVEVQPVATIAPTQIPNQQTIAQILSPTSIETQPKNLSNTTYIASINTKPLVDKQQLNKNIAFIVVTLLFIVFILDILVIERKQIVRIVSHNTDHILFLTVILIIILLFSSGAVL